MFIALALASALDIALDDVSNETLPLATVDGRSMDAEFADLDGDGDLDIVVANEFGQNVVLLQDDAGVFTHAAQALPQGRVHDSEDIAIADFNGDGDLDIVFVAEDDNTNELYLNEGDAHFFDATDALPAPAGTTNAVLAIDIDSDGDLDLLLGNAGSNAVWINDGKGIFKDASDAWLPANSETTQDIEAGDVNGDGLTDLVFANEGDNALLLGQSGGPFVHADPEHFPLNGSMEETREIDLADIDGDGDLDALVANVAWRPGFDGRNRLLLNDGRGHFTEAPSGTLPRDTQSTVDVDLVDLDGDGQLEIIFAQVSGLGVQVLRHDGTRFVDATTTLLGPVPPALKGIDVEVVDVDGDGQHDIYLCHHAGADRLWRGRSR